MSSELAVRNSSPPRSLSIKSIDDAERIARIMSRANTMPMFLKNNQADCFMVIEQAMRWGMSPFLVGQKTSLIRTGGYTNQKTGKEVPVQYTIMYEGQLISAAIVSSGAIQGRLSYEFAGKGDDMTCTCTGRVKGEKQERSVTLKLGDVKKENQMWKKMPEQMLTYISARFWARRHTPDVILGVYAPDEFDEQNYVEEAQDITPKPALQKPEAPNLKKLEQLTDVFCKKAGTFKTSDELSKWITDPGTSKFLETLQDHPEMLKRANDALNHHGDILMQQEEAA